LPIHIYALKLRSLIKTMSYTDIIPASPLAISSKT